MSENEYINATYLGKFQIITKALAEVQPEICDVIDKEEFNEARAVMFRIQRKLYDTINSEDDENLSKFNKKLKKGVDWNPKEN